VLGYRLKGTGAATLRSGVVVLLLFILVCGTGYSVGGGGEAAFWASVITVLPFLSIIYSFIECVAGGVDILGVQAVSVINTVLNKLTTGFSSVNAEFIFRVMLVLHVIVSVCFFISVCSHLLTIHGRSNLINSNGDEVGGASLFSVVESKDIRTAVMTLFITPLCMLQIELFSRMANAQYLVVEVKAPNRVVTELYFANLYTFLRQFPIFMLFCIFFFYFRAVFCSISIH